MSTNNCSVCGHEIPLGAKFCENCGLNLSLVAEPQKDTQPNAPVPAESNLYHSPVKKPKKKSHVGLILGITIPVLVIGTLVILILFGIIKIPFFTSGDELQGTWYQYAKSTTEEGLCSLQDLANLEGRDVNDIRLTMTCNEDGTGQMIGGGNGMSPLYWSKENGRYTVMCDGKIYTGKFETDEQFAMTDNENEKLYFCKDINHQIPNQIEVTPSPAPTSVPTAEPYYDDSPTPEPEADREEDDWEETDEEEESVTDGEYIFPDSDSEYLSKSDLAGMSKSEINLAKNELYARHGRKFKTKELQDYFNSKSWYVGRYSPKEWDKKGDSYFFNEYEIKNRNLLKKYE